MNEVQGVLEELTGLLDVFLRGLVDYNLVSGYSLSLSTCPELLEPSSRTLPLLLSLLQSLQHGIKEMLLQFGKVKIITCWARELEPEKQNPKISPQQLVQEDTVVEEIECNTIDKRYVPDAGKSKDIHCDNCSEEKPTEFDLVIKSEEIVIDEENSECANQLSGDELKSKVIHKTQEANTTISKETKQERVGELKIITLDSISRETSSKIEKNESNLSESTSTAPNLKTTKATRLDANFHNNSLNWDNRSHLDEQEKSLILKQVDAQALEEQRSIHDDNSASVSIDVTSFHEDISQMEEEDQEVSLFEVAQESEEEVNKFEEEMLQKKDLIKSKFECSECHREFKIASSLETHRMKFHTAPQCCDMCGQMVGSTSALQEHCRTVHAGVGCFQCSICKKRFMLRLSFRRHLETHEPATSAVCEICGKTFRRADYLQRHYLSHTGQRPHVCNVCGKRFICSSHLRNHSTLHSKQAHSCDLCGRGFARADKLKEHMLRHLNVKKHACSDCGKEYAERRDLKKHLTRCPENDSTKLNK